MLKPNTQHSDIWRWCLWKVMRLCVEPSQVRLISLQKRPQRAPIPFHHLRTCWKYGCPWSRKPALARQPDLLATWSALLTVGKKKILWFKGHPVYGIFVITSQTKTDSSNESDACLRTPGPISLHYTAAKSITTTIPTPASTHLCDRPGTALRLLS